MAADATVQVQPDSTGKKIETSELVRADDAVVERQRVAIGDADDIGPRATVRGETGRGTLKTGDEAILEQLTQLNKNFSELTQILLTFLNQ